MTYTLYTIMNKSTGHIYVGRTKNENQMENHMYFLNTDQHFARLMQKHHNEGNEFEMNVVETSDDSMYIAEKAIEMVNELDSANPMKGYNCYFDMKDGHKTARINVYDEDVVFKYLKDGKSEALKAFSISSNVFDFRVRRQGFGLNDEQIPVSTYDCLYYYAALEAMLSTEPVSASQLLERCMQAYDISGRLRPTPHKISKNLKKMGLPSSMKGGLSHFTPD